MIGNDLVRELASDLLDRAADAWIADLPKLASRLFDAAALLVEGVGIEPEDHEADR